MNEAKRRTGKLKLLSALAAVILIILATSLRVGAESSSGGMYATQSQDILSPAFTLCTDGEPHEPGTAEECARCGERVYRVIDGVAYAYGGDITFTGLDISKIKYDNACFVAGEGYALLSREDTLIDLFGSEQNITDMRVLILRDADVYISETDATSAFFHTDSLKVRFEGENNIYINDNGGAREHTYGINLQGTAPERVILSLEGKSDATLNFHAEGAESSHLYGVRTGVLILGSGHVDLLSGSDESRVSSLMIIAEQAHLRSCGVILAGGTLMDEDYREAGYPTVTSRGALDALVESFEVIEEGDTTFLYPTLHVFGSVICPKSVTFDFDIENAVTESALVIHSGAVLTVPEGTALDLDAFGSVLLSGRIEGDYICTHEGGEATCTLGRICKRCGTEYEPASGHDMTAWQVSEDGHTRYCVSCGTYTENYPHELSDFEPVDEHTHVKTCTYCGYTVSGEHAFTLENLGLTHKGTCEECGYEFSEPHHSLNSFKMTDARQHTAICGGCGYEVTEEHRLSLFETCGADGHKRYCYDCDYVYTEAHSFTTYWVTTPGDCETRGELLSYCDEHCGEEHRMPDGSTGNGHVWDDGAVTKDPTCSDEGIMTYVCLEDPEHKRTEPIPKDKDAHEYSTPTPYDEKTHSIACKCGNTLYADHIFDEGVVTSHPTCSDEGVLTRTCSKCPATATFPIAAVGHDYDNSCDTTCNACGELREVLSHPDINGDLICDVCAMALPKDGLSSGAVIGIAAGSASLALGGGFAVYLFIIRKKIRR